MSDPRPPQAEPTRFQLTSLTTPQRDCAGARLRLISAVEGFDGEHEITLEIEEAGAKRQLDMAPREAIALGEGRLIFRYLLSGATPQADFEYIADFEFVPR
ncbi:hypothetical protein KKF91_16050 [Myxococcota bacterium]|nr:hypothetical protein [Myxococcota bacterium]MBU1432055.1 hypothetical protein [Myxococcota bacterium]MBU1896374.1 hypothetical protein [Myxococcota bacterium]